MDEGSQWFGGLRVSKMWGKWSNLDPKGSSLSNCTVAEADDFVRGMMPDHVGLAGSDTQKNGPVGVLSSRTYYYFTLTFFLTLHLYAMVRQPIFLFFVAAHLRHRGCLPAGLLILLFQNSFYACQQQNMSIMQKRKMMPGKTSTMVVGPC